MFAPVVIVCLFYGQYLIERTEGLAVHACTWTQTIMNFQPLAPPPPITMTTCCSKATLKGIIGLLPFSFRYFAMRGNLWSTRNASVSSSNWCAYGYCAYACSCDCVCVLVAPLGLEAFCGQIDEHKLRLGRQKLGKWRQNGIWKTLFFSWYNYRHIQSRTFGTKF